MGTNLADLLLSHIVKSVLIIALFFGVSCRLNAQPIPQENDFFLRIDSLPAIYSWDNFTDPSESGTLTENSGSEQSGFLDGVGTNYYFYNLTQYGDTLSLNGYYDNGQYDGATQLTVIFFHKPDIIAKIDFEFSEPYELYYNKLFYHFSLDSVSLFGTDTSFGCWLMGAQILPHALINIRTTYNGDGSGQSWRDTFQFKDSVTSSSLVTFSIGKKLLVQSSVNSVLFNEPKDIYFDPISLKLVIPTSLRIEAEGVNIFDIVGRNVLMIPIKSYDATTHQVDVSPLMPGLYLYSLGNLVGKFTISR